MKLIEFFGSEAPPLLEMRPDSDAFYDLDQADQWLAKYTYEALDRWPSKEIQRTLVQRYPVSEPTTIYRGINLKTKEQYDEFRASIADGQITTGGITSWSPSRDQVESFAVTRPSYYLDLDTMKGYGEARSQREYIQGYRGMILKMVCEPGHGIAVNKSNLGHESEIILIPGTYRVEIEREYKLYKSALEDGDIDVDSVVANHDPDVSTRGREYDHQFYDYVLHHHSDRLADSSKRKIFQMNYKPAEIRVDVEREEIRKYSHDPYPTVSIFYPYWFLQHAVDGRYTDDDTEKAERVAVIVGKKIAKAIQQYPNYIVRISDMGPLMSLGATEPKNALMRHISKQYKDLEAEGRAINNLPGEKRQQAMYEHQKKLELVLNQIKSIS